MRASFPARSRRVDRGAPTAKDSKTWSPAELTALGSREELVATPERVAAAEALGGAILGEAAPID